MKGLLVAAVVLATAGIGTTAAAAPARSDQWKAWCVQHGEVLQANSLATPLICPTSSRKAAPKHKQKAQLSGLDLQIALAINNFRRAHHLVPLRISVQLDAASRQHSQEMGADGYFDHDSANGTLWWKRIQHYYPSKGYTYWTVGENLLFASPDIGADAAMQEWIGSPEHLRNLLNPAWRDLGVSAVHMSNAGGVYGGNPVTIITTDFGARH